jgi:hypothetical protein
MAMRRDTINTKFVEAAHCLDEGSQMAEFHPPYDAMKRLLIAATVIFGVAVCCTAEAARPRRPSAAQIKQMQERAKYMQQEVIRYQTEIAAKEREFYLSFDQNGNGHLEGGEKARYDTHLHAIQTGKEPNPTASIAPVGKGPKDWKGSTATPYQSKK